MLKKLIKYLLGKRGRSSKQRHRPGGWQPMPSPLLRAGTNLIRTQVNRRLARYGFNR